MTIQGQLLDMLETVAAALGDDLCNQMVFVGGCSTAVLVTDDITLQEVRATEDVDLIVDLSGVGQWMHLQEKLHKKGFTISSEDEVICRMRLGSRSGTAAPGARKLCTTSAKAVHHQRECGSPLPLEQVAFLRTRLPRVRKRDRATRTWVPLSPAGVFHARQPRLAFGQNQPLSTAAMASAT